MAYKDKDKRRAYDRKWSKENHARRIETNKKWQQKVRTWFEDFKKTLKCELCSEKETCCLDFHHLNPKEKDLAVAEGIHNGWSIERLKEEIAKCAVLCSNCHRKVHAGVAQLVVHHSCKVGVVGSTPIVSSKSYDHSRMHKMQDADISMHGIRESV